MNVVALHATLAAVTAAAGFALVASGGWAAFRRDASSINQVLLVRQVTLVATVLAVGVGGLLFVQGHRPHAALHYLYAVLALVVVPLAISLAARQPRRGGWYHMGAGVLLLLMCYRLATTG